MKTLLKELLSLLGFIACVIVLTISFCSCSPKVTGNSLIEQRKAHTQRVTSKDIGHARIFIFAAIGLGLYIGANISSNDK